MKKVLIISPYPYDEAPSQRYRYEHFLPLFEKHNLQYTLAPFFNTKMYKIMYGAGKKHIKLLYLIKGFLGRLFLLFKIKNYDFILIHREATPIGPPWFEHMASKLSGNKIIFDFDDAIWHPITSKSNRWIHGLKNASKINSTLKNAYKVSAGNKYLQKYAQQFNNNVVVIPTIVNTEAVHNKLKEHIEKEEVTIGWTGTHSTEFYLKDLELILLDLSKKFNLKFLVISNGQIEWSLQNVEFKAWKKSREAEDLLDIDIGIMPLRDDEWSKGKCGFKAIQYMALGIPTVAANVGVNGEIIQSGKNGFLVTTDEDWHNALSSLIKDINLRIEFGEQARKKIQDEYSVNSQVKSFFDLFK